MWHRNEFPRSRFAVCLCQMKHMERWKVLSYCHDTGGLFTDGCNTYVLDDIERWCILDDAIKAIDKQSESEYTERV